MDRRCVDESDGRLHDEGDTDASLNERVIPISVTGPLWSTAAAFGGSRLAELRSLDSTGLLRDRQLLMVDVEAGVVEATLPLPDTGAIAFSR